MFTDERVQARHVQARRLQGRPVQGGHVQGGCVIPVANISKSGPPLIQELSEETDAHSATQKRVNNSATWIPWKT